VKHYIKALERILLLEDRVKAIEKKQAERFPMLVGKLNKIEEEVRREKNDAQLRHEEKVFGK
jgi:hypothetical protein